ncbi:MAG: hypothetical protein J5850_03485 [Clostridia bacterium]|nr:hypothetical protein [Clostridia bacterium]
MIFNKLNNNIRIRIDNCLNEGKFNSLFVAVSLVFLLLFQCGCSSDTVIPYADEQSDEIIESALNAYYRKAVAIVVPQKEYIENDEKYLRLGFGVIYHDEKTDRTSLYLNYIYRYKGQDDGTVTVLEENSEGDIILSAGGKNFKSEMKYSIGNSVDDVERGIYRDTLTLVYSDNLSAKLPYENETEYDLICPDIGSIKMKIYPVDRYSDDIRFYSSYGITIIVSSEYGENTVSVSLTVFADGNHKPVAAINALDNAEFRNIKLKQNDNVVDYISFKEHDIFTNVTTFYFPFNGSLEGCELDIDGFYAPREVYKIQSMKDLTDKEIENFYSNEGPTLLLPVPAAQNEPIALNAEMKFPYGQLTVDSVSWVRVGEKDYLKLDLSNYGKSVICPCKDKTDETAWQLVGFSVIKSFYVSDDPLFDTDGEGFMTAVYLPFNPPNLSNERVFKNGVWHQKHEMTYGLYYIVKNINIPLLIQQ